MDAKQLQAIREQFGFIVSTDKDPDLLGYLVNAFMEDAAKDGGEVDPLEAQRLVGFLNKFVEHARETLRQNPPVTLTYMERGLSVQLQNYQYLTLVEPKKEEEKPKKPVRMDAPITEASNRGGGMRGMIWRDTTTPVTGEGPRDRK